MNDSVKLFYGDGIYKLNRKWDSTNRRTRAEGAEGEANKSAETAPNGATVIESPFGVNNWSSFPNMATATNAPDDF